MIDSKQQKNDSAPFDTNQEHPRKKNDTKPIRTIMLIGRTGGGKSALANVIAGTDDFDEGSGCTSETRNYQIIERLIEGTSYRIVDTIGIGDTKFTEQQVLFNLAEAADSIKYGLSQILFVINGRFTETEIQAYDLLRAVIFDKDVVKYTTIVRTCFPEFNNSDKCKKDYKNMIKDDGNLSEIVQKCKKVIHVDNPQLVGYYKDIAEMSRADSREKILDHLSDCNEIYFPKNLVGINDKIGNYMTEKEKLQKEVEILKKKVDEKTEEKKHLEKDLRKAQEKIKNLNEKIAELTARLIPKKFKMCIIF
ncbi:16585_t:CDS:1 [Entrophospora sp. SA101]|nr:16585_t:CDS:1 [Entrophospora sp. SA101]CAJ0873578.1 3764_t:CDS:1 [Entrophospora sp. SA101]CAJ0898637.1 13203_t:CDS:1 [Entrophospora sp. SA101]